MICISYNQHPLHNNYDHFVLEIDQNGRTRCNITLYTDIEYKEFHLLPVCLFYVLFSLFIVSIEFLWKQFVSKLVAMTAGSIIDNNLSNQGETYFYY